MERYKPAPVRNILQAVSTVLAILFFLIIALSSLDHWNLISADSIMIGISYLPPIWLLPAAFVLIILSLFLNKHKQTVLTFIVYCFYFALWGDYSIKISAKEQVPSIGKEPLKVLSLNVRYYSFGADKVLGYIDSLGCDINLLSENTLSADSIEQVLQQKGNYFVVAGKKYETAILSKYPVLSYKEVDFPTHQASLSGSNYLDSIKNNPYRSFSHITIKYNNEIVNVISVRFIAGRPKNKSLKEQIKWGNYLVNKHVEEVDFFVDYLKRLKGPVIFGGDLNVPPNSKVMDKLYDVAKDAAHYKTLIPAPTFRTELPVMRLDYIFTTKGLKVIDYARLKSIVSDHFPVYAKVELNKQ